MDTLEQQIFSLLCKYTGEKLSQRDIARKLNVSPTAVSKALIKSKNLVKIEKTKTINFITLNRDNPEAIEHKIIENMKNIYTSGLKDFLSEKLAGSTIVLFGSYCRGEDTIDSDIDLAVIGRQPKELQLKAFEKKLYRRININFYSSWKNVQKNLRNNILNGLVLHGSVEL